MSAIELLSRDAGKNLTSGPCAAAATERAPRFRDGGTAREFRARRRRTERHALGDWKTDSAARGLARRAAVRTAGPWGRSDRRRQGLVHGRQYGTGETLRGGATARPRQIHAARLRHGENQCTYQFRVALAHAALAGVCCAFSRYRREDFHHVAQTEICRQRV